MAIGQARQVITLYTETGEPVAVELVDGAYRLLTHDPKVHELLDAVVEKLADLTEVVASLGE